LVRGGKSGVLVNEAYEWRKMSVTAKLLNRHEATQALFVIRILRRQQDGSWKFARDYHAVSAQGLNSFLTATTPARM